MSRLVDAWLQVPLSHRKRWVLLLATAVIMAWILWAARAVLGPYLLGLSLAYILAPLVRLLERGWSWLGKRRGLGFFRRAARPLSIVVTYLLLIAILVGFFSMIVPLVIEQGKALWAEREAIWVYISGLTDSLIAQYRLLPPTVQTQIEGTLSKFSERLGGIVQQGLTSTAVVISYTFSLVLAILIIPFWTFFLLLDSKRLANALVRSIPASIREDALKVGALVDASLSSYLRGQLFLGLIIGVVSTTAFMAMGINFAVVLGLIAGLFELIPNIGPVLGAIPAILVALSQDPVLALATVIYAIVIQQVENLFISPRVLGRSVQLHPVLVMVVLVIGSEIGGVLGLFLAPVVTAVLRDLFRYIYFRLDEVPLPPDEALQKTWHIQEFEINV